MTDLSEFLLARIAEDEGGTREITDAPDADYSADWTLPSSATVDVGDDDLAAGDQRLARHIARHDPARVLAECEAKRRIVDVHASGEHLCPSPDALEDGLWSVTDQDVMTPCPTLRLLALPYADHPDYDEAWRL